jgi:predicted  nucleic acid-binding Zn-ribbon protein
MNLMEQLLVLHRVNAQVLGLQGRLDSAKRFLDAQQGSLDRLLERDRELRSQIRQLEATAGNLEGESTALQVRIEKLRLDLNASQNDRQYQAILVELKGLQEKRDEIETQALVHLERIEGLRGHLGELAAEVAAQTKVRDAAAAEFDQRHRDVAERLAELTAERNRAASVLPDATRTLFARISEETDGEVMAQVEVVSRRHHEYACGACNLEIPKESVSRLAGNGNLIVQCRACGRILFNREESTVPAESA